MESKSKSSQVSPEGPNPILNQPTTQTIVGSNQIANNVEGVLASLNLLSGIGRLYIQHALSETNDNPDVKIFHVSNEAGECIFNVNVTLKSYFSCKICLLGCICFPRKLISKIEINNPSGNQIIIADYQDPIPNNNCMESLQDIVADRVQFNVHLGNYMPLGQFNYTAEPMKLDPSQFVVDCLLNQDKFLIEGSGVHLLFKMCYYCRQRFHLFRIKQYSSYSDVLGEMHIEWPENLGVFGIRFPQTMPIESKAMLLVLGIYLNEQYLEKKCCCGHVGNIGHYQIATCTVQTLFVFIVLACVVISLFFVSDLVKLFTK